MAHVRGNNYKPTTTVTLNPMLLEKIEDYRFTKRKDNRSQTFEELIAYGFKYIELREKHRAKKAEMSS